MLGGLPLLFMAMQRAVEPSPVRAGLTSVQLSLAVQQVPALACLASARGAAPVLVRLRRLGYPASWLLDVSSDGATLRAQDLQPLVALQEHHNYVCDACRAEDFLGFRYTCTQCENFDMCTECFLQCCPHDPSHVFVRTLATGYPEGEQVPVGPSKVTYRANFAVGARVALTSRGDIMNDDDDDDDDLHSVVSDCELYLGAGVIVDRDERLICVQWDNTEAGVTTSYVVGGTAGDEFAAPLRLAGSGANRNDAASMAQYLVQLLETGELAGDQTVVADAQLLGSILANSDTPTEEDMASLLAQDRDGDSGSEPYHRIIHLGIDADGINTRIQGLHVQGVCKGQVVTGSTAYEDVTVSSRPQHLHHLLDNDTSTYWESAGPSGTHWIRLQMLPGVIVTELSLLCTATDSYRPITVKVKVGPQPEDLTSLLTVACDRVRQPNGIIPILEGPPTAVPSNPFGSQRDPLGASLLAEGAAEPEPGAAAGPVQALEPAHPEVLCRLLGREFAGVTQLCALQHCVHALQIHLSRTAVTAWLQGGGDWNALGRNEATVLESLLLLLRLAVAGRLERDQQAALVSTIERIVQRQPHFGEMMLEMCALELEKCAAQPFLRPPDTIESAHPIETVVHEADWHVVRGATALKVVFDKKSSLSRKTDVLVVSDALGNVVATREGPRGPTWEEPIVVVGSTLQWRLLAHGSGSAPHWGFRCFVTPLVELGHDMLFSDHVVLYHQPHLGFVRCLLGMYDLQGDRAVGTLHAPAALHTLANALAVAADLVAFPDRPRTWALNMLRSLLAQGRGRTLLDLPLLMRPTDVAAGRTAETPVGARPRAPVARPTMVAGMRLEACLRHGAPGQVAVAHVARVEDSRRVRIEFDGLPSSNSYVTSVSSDELHPVGWCAQQTPPVPLQVPPGYTPETFDWARYLRQGQWTAVPAGLLTSASNGWFSQALALRTTLAELGETPAGGPSGRRAVALSRIPLAQAAGVSGLQYLRMSGVGLSLGSQARLEALLDHKAREFMQLHRDVPAAVVAEYKRVFMAHDRNMSGTLDLMELRQLLQHYLQEQRPLQRPHVTHAQLQTLMSLLDTNRDNTIDFLEFLGLVRLADQSAVQLQELIQSRRLVQTPICSMLEGGSAQRTPLEAFVQRLPSRLLEQMAREVAAVRGGDHLAHSLHFRSMLQLAYDLGLPRLPCCQSTPPAGFKGRDDFASAFEYESYLQAVLQTDMDVELMVATPGLPMGSRLRFRGGIAGFQHSVSSPGGTQLGQFYSELLGHALALPLSSIKIISLTDGAGAADAASEAAPRAPHLGSGGPFTALTAGDLGELIESIRQGETDTVAAALSAHVDPNTMDDVGQTLLNWAAAYGTLEMVVLLCDAGADVDGGERGTSLHFAAAFERTDICQELLRRGARTDMRDMDGRTPQEVAQQHGYQGVVALLTSPPTADGGTLATAASAMFGGQWAWLQRYSLLVRVQQALVKREPLPLPFLKLCRAHELIMAESQRKPQQTRALHHEDNTYFTAAMDAQVVEWFSNRPQDLVPGSGKGQEAPLKVLLVAADTPAAVEDVRKRLSYGFGLNVDSCHLHQNPLSLSLLQKYECVLVWVAIPRESEVTVDLAATGDALADFVDGGGSVVACYQSHPLGGRWSSSAQYAPMALSGDDELVSADVSGPFAPDADGLTAGITHVCGPSLICQVCK